MRSKWRRTACHGKPTIIVAILLGAFVLIQSRISLRTAVQIGADEGFEVAKVTLCLHGHKLYSEVWNDQPPLHTFLVTQVVKLLRNAPLAPSRSPSDGEKVASGRERGPSILGPRLVTTAFTCILLACVFLISWRVTGLLAERSSFAGDEVTRLKSPNGLFVGTWTTALLIASPGSLELSSSCMLEIPALAMAIAGLCVLLVVGPNKWHIAEILSGILFGVAALMKLVPVYLLPLAALI